MSSDFTVIIVGGSIAGLTLSHCLNAAGIKNIVLEKHGEIAAQVGASIGVLPNGGRILDQLGIFHRIEKLIEPLTRAHIAYPDGFTLRSEYPVTVQERFGRPMSFLTRQELIQILHDSFEDPSHIHVNKCVARVQQGKDSVSVVTEDGASYEGDLVVGADGVHSKVRAEMWSFHNSPELARVALREHRALKVEYSCIYGISSALPGLEVGEQVATFADGFTIMTYQGLGGRVYWFVIEKLDRKYTYPHIPRFTDQDAVRNCERLGSVWLRNSVHFRDVWRCRETFAMTALEEAVLRPWSDGRIVCIGDSIHKMTPNLGQGANLAIEDAAELANTLHALLTSHRMRNPGAHKHQQKPSAPSLTTALTSFERKHLARATHIVNMSALMSRLHARQGLFYTILGRYIPPLFPSLPAELISAVVHGAPVLEFLPVPPREATGWVLLERVKGVLLGVVVVFACLLSGIAFLRLLR
ncbi:hypothetical protein BJX68DRAFT_270569 [Aspergillus pseudodeflectus]|uniref:FAD-binding domain-containing protein n=1 Tax=Aspergillus pseudodeflectus TaxID=176178 RepID=A0ABR4JRI6_9EURO